jgi:shikimate dehydrogenase
MSRRYLVGLIGSGVASSLTPELHMREAEAQGLTYVYRTVDLDDHELRAESIGEIVSFARTLGFDGLNITHPCKQLVIPHLDVLDARARELDAVNTVVFGPQGASGHNTDWSGFSTAFNRGLPEVSREVVVLVGAGGAGASVGNALLTLGVRRLMVLDLEPRRAQKLANKLGDVFGTDRCVAASTDRLPDLAKETDGFVHCTPMGMADHPGTPFDTALLEERHWVADIVYRPLETELVRAARSAGCRTLDGGGMAVYQAVDAFELITDRKANDQRMLGHFGELVATS